MKTHEQILKECLEKYGQPEITDKAQLRCVLDAMQGTVEDTANRLIAFLAIISLVFGGFMFWLGFTYVH